MCLFLLQLLSRVDKFYPNFFSFDNSFTVSLILEFAAVFLLGEEKSKLSLLSRVEVQVFGKGVLIKYGLGQGRSVFNSQLWRRWVIKSKSRSIGLRRRHFSTRKSPK